MVEKKKKKAMLSHDRAAAVWLFSAGAPRTHTHALHNASVAKERSTPKSMRPSWALDGNIMETLSPSKTAGGDFENMRTIKLTNVSQFGPFDVMCATSVDNEQVELHMGQP